jgi:hypothetical protein
MNQALWSTRLGKLTGLVSALALCTGGKTLGVGGELITEIEDGITVLADPFGVSFIALPPLGAALNEPNTGPSPRDPVPFRQDPDHLDQREEDEDGIPSADVASSDAPTEALLATTALSFILC